LDEIWSKWSGVSDNPAGQDRFQWKFSGCAVSDHLKNGKKKKADFKHRLEDERFLPSHIIKNPEYSCRVGSTPQLSS
jgi:hypothetical protein